MDTRISPPALRTANYCRCGLIFLDGTGRVSGLTPGFFASAGLNLELEAPLPEELRNLEPGQWRFWGEGWFVQAEGREEVEVLLIRPVRSADRILGPYGDCPVNEEMVRLVLDNPYEGLTAVDPEGRVTFLSPTNEAWFGLERGGATGLLLSDLSPASRLPEVARTGVPDRAQLMDLAGQTKVTVNLPVRHDKEVIGAVGRILFQSPEQVQELADRVRTMERQVERYETLLAEMRGRRWSFGDILTTDPQMLRVIDQARRVADSAATVLLLGESGTGKELFAQALHEASRRKKGPFVAVNCAAIPRDLLESELFGYEEGAFSGARRKGKPGKFELATGGTLFLDEVGELPQDSQAKLLRVLEERSVERLGGTSPLSVDFRLVVATNRDLAARVAKGEFRSDLYYRVHEIPLELPPLRARPGDIPLLARHFLAEVCQRESLPSRRLSREALDALARYAWPGNVRELRSLMRQMAWQVQGTTIDSHHLPPTLDRGRTKAVSGTLEEELARAERSAVESALEAAGGNRAQAARRLGIHRTALYKKMARLGVR
ncbi:MAG: sigma 54-interacting transcriptional regulator [Deltaproteobacteria bacterium]|nr:sigma 54-interacting transcriptional regulator [Deltaproteobacteria bacterium]